MIHDRRRRGHLHSVLNTPAEKLGLVGRRVRSAVSPTSGGVEAIINVGLLLSTVYFGPGLIMVQQSLAERCQSIHRWMSGHHTGRSSLGNYCIW
jgi:hypothetical protein